MKKSSHFKDVKNPISFFPEDFLKQVKLLEINLRKLINSLLTGKYQAIFKGQGMIFAEFREYVYGDDVRHISWNLTAKTGKPHIKKYDEERELNIVLIVDVSGSSHYGSGTYLKKEIMTQLAALLALTALKGKDCVGLLLCSSQVERFVPPQKGRGHIYRILRDLLYFKPKKTNTDLQEAFEHLMNVLKKKSAIFVFSDFLDSHFEKSLSQIAQKHDVVALQIIDQTELDLPHLGLVNLQDPETKQTFTMDTSDPFVRRHYSHRIQELHKKCHKRLKSTKVDVIKISSEKDFMSPLVAYFKRRHRR